MIIIKLYGGGAYPIKQVTSLL